MPRSKFVNSEPKSVKAPVEEKEIKEPIIEKAPEKKKFRDNDGIKCRSAVSGNLYIEGLKTKMIYNWIDYGDETEVDYVDLVAAVRSRDKSVYEPRIIVDDPDFLAEFPVLEKFYSDKFTTRDLRAILNMPVDDMINAIEKLPNGAKESVKTLAAKEVANGELDSVGKIKALDKLFGTDLNLIGSFNED